MSKRIASVGRTLARRHSSAALVGLLLVGLVIGGAPSPAQALEPGTCGLITGSWTSAGSNAPSATALVVQPDCTLAETSLSVTLPTGVRVAPPQAPQAITSFTTPATVRQWLRDSAGYTLNEPQLNVSWRNNLTAGANGRIYDWHAVPITDYARGGRWTVASSGATRTSGDLQHVALEHHAAYTYSDGSNVRSVAWANYVVIVSDGSTRCSGTFSAQNAVVGWTFAGMCWSYPQGTYIGGL